MNIDRLAQDAFMARALTGYEPTDNPPVVVMDAGCAMDENKNPVRERIEFIKFSIGGGDFTTVSVRWTGHVDHVADTLILAVPDLSHGGASTGESTTSKLIFVKRKLLHALAEFKEHLPADTYSVILVRLGTILDPDEWNLRDELPDAGSFDQMLFFLARHKELCTPRVFLSPKGFFVASWRAARNQLTTLEFYPDRKIRWLVFAPPLPDEQTKHRGTGDGSARKIWSYIAPYGALKWMKRAGK